MMKAGGLPDMATGFDVAAHIAEERRELALLSQVRQIIFGMQDGLITSVGVVSAVGAAATDTWFILVAAFATAFAGAISMAAGEYISSKSQREVYEAQIERERQEVRENPEEAYQEVKYLFEAEGLSSEDAREVSERISHSEESWLHTMVQKELGLQVEEHTSVAWGALAMGISYFLIALIPILPYLALARDVALLASLGLAGLVLFGIGAGKARLAERSLWRSGLEVTLIGALSGASGYLIGSLLPSLLGAWSLT